MGILKLTICGNGEILMEANSGSISMDEPTWDSFGAEIFPAFHPNWDVILTGAGEGGWLTVSDDNEIGSILDRGGQYQYITGQ